MGKVARCFTVFILRSWPFPAVTAAPVGLGCDVEGPPLKFGPQWDKSVVEAPKGFCALRARVPHGARQL